jgi:hypothetical protein
MTTTTDIKYGADVLDVRDLIQRFEEIEDAISDHEGGATVDEDDLNEAYTLRAFLAEIVGMGGDEEWRGDWYPTGLIRDSYFEDYARELADDIGAIDRHAQWPTNHIDWESAAEALQEDYTSAVLDGVLACASESRLYRGGLACTAVPCWRWRSWSLDG